LAAATSAAPVLLAQSCLPVNASTETNDNVANTGSPFILTNGANLTFYYNNHSTNTLQADGSSTSSGSGGQLGTPQPVTTPSGGTFPIGTNTGLEDVSGAVLFNTVFLDFVNSSNQVEVISEPTTGTPGGFEYLTSFSSIGGVSVNVAYTPTFVAYNSLIYVAL
jgi:hypothetical protein